ncbi:MAG: hypothetical protein WC091_02685 [Sulfuricellaceae bacterium]
MAKPKKIAVVENEAIPDATALPAEVAAPAMAAPQAEVVCGYTGAKDPTKLDASDLNYTHQGSPAHLAWLKLKGL